MRKASRPFTAREVLLAIGIVAVFVGAFFNFQVVKKALSATMAVSTILPGPDR